MPTTAEILRGLTRIANEARYVSIAWHVVAGISILLVLAGFRPRQRTSALLLSLPLFSVSALALNFGNPFNAAAFALLAFGLAVLASSGRAAVPLGPSWAVTLGTLLMAFGWIYPHFVATTSWLTYLYAAPLGSIPCPTLSFVVGVALVGGGFALDAWCVTLAFAACFYALFGVFRLGVAIDVVLLAGGIGLLVLRLQHRPANRVALRS
ncbi:MAG TPA: hypothetical protein VFQ35_08240 [Polyangiaceae bacterium]|nr:hypothetical protein [Polyangiaceae bacterium]